jgi:hypothetical protein
LSAKLPRPNMLKYTFFYIQLIKIDSDCGISYKNLIKFIFVKWIWYKQKFLICDWKSFFFPLYIAGFLAIFNIDFVLRHDVYYVACRYVLLCNNQNIFF